ncbi:MAG: sigma-70 family RNA polymerase sigma factor [Oscillospiraceae bacterium]|nr:sigma-70 family RNA polymerase sigma factor [Oscillospiraceae bacterium]
MSGMTFAAVDRYQDLVYRTALTVTGNVPDAEDVMQEVFFRYFRSHPVFESETHERAWLIRVTVNTGRNLLRSAWRRKRVDFDPELLVQSEEQSRDSRVLRAVMALPEKYRIAIYLYYYEEYSIREIAELTEQSESAVSQQLSRGRRKLRSKLGGAKA